MMSETTYTTFFTPEELELKASLEARLHELAGDSLREKDMTSIEELLTKAIEAGCLKRDCFGLNPIINNLQTAIIVADEIGSEGDAEALAEAARCGVSVITSAHAGDFAALMARRTLRGAVETGVFAIGVLLSGAPGHIAELRACELRCEAHPKHLRGGMHRR